MERAPLRARPRWFRRSLADVDRAVPDPGSVLSVERTDLDAGVPITVIRRGVRAGDRERAGCKRASRDRRAPPAVVPDAAVPVAWMPRARAVPARSAAPADAAAVPAAVPA